MNQIFFELIQVAIGIRICLSRTPNETEWGELYAMAKKQSLVGVCFAGVQKLQLQRQEPPEMLYLTWMGMAAKIQQRNEVVTKQCAELQAKLSADGFKSCILKGQGVASLYSEHLRGLRLSGDIDVWVDGGFEKVNSWVQRTSPTDKINMHHIQLDVFTDTEIEVHYVPFIHHSPFKQKILSAFYEETKDACTKVEQSGKLVTPSTEFNLVFLLLHIFHHFLTEGVGFRQVMDYYFVLRDAQTKGYTSTSSAQALEFQKVSEVQEVVSRLGLDRFASALMWVLCSVFENSQTPQTFQALWTPNEKDGRIVLERIMMQGNFGKQADDNLTKMRFMNRAWHRLKMSANYYRFDHGYWFWGPYDGIKTKLWQMKHGYKNE